MKEKLKWIIPIGMIIGIIAIAIVLGVMNQTANEENTVGQSANNNEQQVVNTNSQNNAETQTTTTGKTLIIYYSLTTRTERVAQRLAETTGGDLYKIETTRTYPDVVREVSAEAREERESGNLPELKGNLPNLNDYDLIIVGGPVWSSTIATPLMSFLEQMDFAGKDVAPYWTDDGMPGRYETDFKEQANNANVLAGIGITNINDLSDEQIDNEINTWLQAID